MKEFLLDDDNESYEIEKAKYLIQSGYYNYKYDKNYFKDPEQSKKFEEKYLRAEFMYFIKDEYSCESKIREKIQKKFKTPGEVLETLDKIKSFPSKYPFMADLFYQELPQHLQVNKKILDKILDCRGKTFPFKQLNESLQYNSDVALKFIQLNPENTLDVPKEFFNDINFSLEFAKLMDKGLFSAKESLIPEFITKFFDNQGIKENYHQNLNNYVSTFSLKEILDEKPAVQKKRLKV